MLTNLIEWLKLQFNVFATNTPSSSDVLKFLGGLVIIIFLVYMFFYLFKIVFSKKGLLILIIIYSLCSMALNINNTPTFNINSDTLIQELNDSYKSSTYEVTTDDSTISGVSPNERLLFILYKNNNFILKKNNYTKIEITFQRSSDYQTNMAILDDLCIITNKLDNQSLISNDCISLVGDNPTLKGKTIEKDTYVIKYTYKEDSGTELLEITPK